MNKPIILDLDCVLADISGLMREAFYAATGRDIPVSQWHQYHVDTIYGTTFDVLLNALVEHEVLERAEPYSGAQEAVGRLRERFPVIVCSNRSFHPDAQRVTENWLSYYGFNVDGIVVNSHAHCKAEACHPYGEQFSYIIDDHVDNIRQALASGRVERGGLIWQPWNKNEHETEQIRGHADVTECASFLTQF
jgi:5'(3')-deoxyribonucleotidase